MLGQLPLHRVGVETSAYGTKYVADCVPPVYVADDFMLAPILTWPHRFDRRRWGEGNGDVLFFYESRFHLRNANGLLREWR